MNYKRTSNFKGKQNKKAHHFKPLIILAWLILFSIYYQEKGLTFLPALLLAFWSAGHLILRTEALIWRSMKSQFNRSKFHYHTPVT